MIKSEKPSNSQYWELEVDCKNKKYLNKVVKSLLKYGMINFEVELVDFLYNHEEGYDARYTVFMWCSSFNNLKNITKDLVKIEKKLN